MNWLNRYIVKNASSDPESLLESLKPGIAAAAQAVYDSWEQDDDGVDEVFGGGGVCDAIASDIGNILSSAGFDLTDGGGEGDDHAWNVAVMGNRAFGVDVPCRLYETGSGYSWKKKPGVQLTAGDVTVFEIPYDDIAESMENRY